VRKIAFVLPVIFGGVLAMSAQMAMESKGVHLPKSSSWRLNLAKTDFGGGPKVKSDEFTMTQDTAAMVSWTETSVDGDGNKTETSFGAPEDGQMHPVRGVAGQRASVSPEGKLQIKMADGSLHEMQESLSADGKQAIYTGTVTTKDGKTFHQKWVFDRVGSMH
jgi:hypothetical protein